MKFVLLNLIVLASGTAFADQTFEVRAQSLIFPEEYQAIASASDRARETANKICVKNGEQKAVQIGNAYNCDLRYMTQGNVATCTFKFTCE